LISLLGVPPAKIDVVLEGVGVPLATGPSEQELRARLALGDRTVVLTTSAMRPHKNLGRLLDALSLLPEERRPVLVLPGYSTEHESELRAHAAGVGVSQNVRFVGWVSPEELEGLYGVASCFVFPSLYEGFGLPVLEAMVRGLPVACSDRGALPEVVGDAALIFDAESPRSIADAIEELLQDEALAAKLRRAGLERARGLTWTATAHATLRSYESALGSSS
jgi:glycosyltransferase involved in cell wall biosynthesis